MFASVNPLPSYVDYRAKAVRLVWLGGLWFLVKEYKEKRMLNRKSVIFMSFLVSVIGGSNAEAGLFGRRMCGQIASRSQNQHVESVNGVSRNLAGNCSSGESIGMLSASDYVWVTRTRLVTVTKYRCETRTRTVLRNGRSVQESYAVNVPYQVQVEQTFTEKVPVMSDKTAAAPQIETEFIKESITITVGGTVKTVEIKIPANVSLSEKVAFRELFRKVSEALTGVDINEKKDDEQQETLDRHDKKLETLMNR